MKSRENKAFHSQFTLRCQDRRFDSVYFNICFGVCETHSVSSEVGVL